jgi:hypothetical protein
MASRTRTRRNLFIASVGTLAITGSLVLTGCGNTDDDDDDCDSMGTTRSTDTLAAAAHVVNADNSVELPTATTLPDFGSVPFALQANTQADGNTTVLADDCDDDDGDDD